MKEVCIIVCENCIKGKEEKYFDKFCSICRAREYPMLPINYISMHPNKKIDESNIPNKKTMDRIIQNVHTRPK